MKDSRAALRIDIERALDELISNEEGMRFQGLAVVLAKQKWPDLIACERKADLGLDAYAPASTARDGIGKGLACSLSATLGKIKDDATKIQQHFRDVKILIFVTPLPVTNQTAKRWANVIGEAYGYDLIVISREDIVTSLMVPSNAPICRSHLGIPVAVEEPVVELLTRTQEAAAETVAAWLAHPRLVGRPMIALQAVKLDQEGKETGEVLGLADLQAALLKSRRIVLEAPAGRGKTTTLVQLAKRHGDRGELAFLVDMPEWMTSGGIDLLEFITSTQAFRLRGVRTEDLARLYGAVHCSFLLNGWNEVSDTYSEQAVRALAHLERDFPRAGIIVATRTHHIRPPLPGSFRAALLPLSRGQRTEYLQQALAGHGGELGALLDGDRVLDDLTRTPLILAEVTAIFQSGDPIPETKAGVLGAVMRLVEQSDEHRDYLERPPLMGHSRDYLTELAVQMTTQGVVTIGEAHARSIVHSVSLRLSTGRQIATLPEPAAVLGTLCAHHVLERREYPSVAFRFEHQQFQEFYAALALKRQLWDLIGKDDPDGNRRFAREYVNRPMWEEPLRMIAEEIGKLSLESSGSADAVAAGRRLIELALEIDPVFAGELSRLCGPLVWREVRTAVGERLRAWYRTSDENHQRCALAGMLASGSEDFSDILLPLLMSDDQQVRLRTYRAWDEFHLSSLGGDWRNVVEGWGEEQRADFVGEVAQRRWMTDVAEEFARRDPSLRVRTAALHALEWVGATGALSRVLTEMDDQAFDQVLRDNVLHRVPAEVRPRALEAYRRLVTITDEPVARVRFRLAATNLGATDVSDNVKEDLGSWPPARVDAAREPLLRSALDVVRRTDPQWVSQWVAARIIDGSLWPDRWITLISGIPEALKEGLFAKLSAEDLQHTDDRRIIAVLAATADADLVGRAFSALRTLRTEISSATGEEKQRRWAIARQLYDLIRALPLNLAVAGMLQALSATPTALEYEIVAELFGRVNSDDPDLKGHLPEDLRQHLRRFLKDGLSLVLSQEDFSGELKANAALALARVGEPEDTRDLERLIRADIERVQRGLEARIRGERSDAANGAAMRWSNWYVRAVVWLDPTRAEDVLLALLSVVEYEGDAAAELVRLARTETVNRPLGRELRDYSAVWNLREGGRPSGFDDGRRRRYTNAVKERISVIMEARSQSGDPDSFNGRLKSLATRIAVLDGRESADFVMEILALPGKWDGWGRVDAVEALVLSGARLGAETTLRVLNPTIDDDRTQGFHDQQARYLLQRCLSLLPFIEPCAVGVARIREVVASTGLAPYELREIVSALGHSRCVEALDLLRHLAIAAGGGFQSLATEWIDAIAALGTAESKRILLSFVDPDIGQTGLEQHLEYYHRERLASRIVDIAQSEPGVKDRLYSLCAKQLPATMRLLLADVVARLGTREAMIAGLDLIHDQAKPAVPYELLRGIENVFLERRPYGGSGHAYTLEPRAANEIKSRLFAMVLNDNNRRRSAWALLGQIEWWRLEYGRPSSEARHPALDSGAPWPPIKLAG